MRKRYTVVAIALAAAMALTGCSMDDVKEKFTGTQAAESQTVTGGSIEIESYRPEECVSLAEYKGIEVDCTVTDDDVQKKIDELVSQNVTYTHVKKGTVKKGMDVNIDYVGKIDGKKFDNGSAEDQMLEVGSSGYIDGFDDGLIGMKVGETKDLNLTFPSDYSLNESLAGKDVVFTVTLNYIAKEKKPDFNDKFVKANTTYKTVEAYKKGTKEELQQTKKENAGSTALATVLQNSKAISIPATLKEAEKQQISNYNEAMIAQYGMDLTSYLEQVNMSQEQYETQLNNYAEDNALMLLVVESIAAKENLTATEEERNAAMQTTLTNSGMTEEQYRSQYKSIYGDVFAFEEFLRQSVLYEKVLNLLQENAVIKE